MGLIEPMIKEFKREADVTRKVLERIPEEHFAWKPHAKSMSMAALGSHVAESFQWVEAILNLDEFEVDAEQHQPFVAKSKAELLDVHDAAIAKALAAMQGQPDESLLANWQFKAKGKVVLEMPRVAFLRSFVVSHLIHHRGQLTVYLRLKDVPLPQVYGPSADEPGM